MSLPVVIWLPLGAVTFAVAALGWCFLLAFILGENGGWHPKWLWNATWAMLAVAGAVTMLLGGVWWWLGPF